MTASVQVAYTPTFVVSPSLRSRFDSRINTENISVLVWCLWYRRWFVFQNISALITYFSIRAMYLMLIYLFICIIFWIMTFFILWFLFYSRTVIYWILFVIRNNVLLCNQLKYKYIIWNPGFRWHVIRETNKEKELMCFVFMSKVSLRGDCVTYGGWS